MLLFHTGFSSKSSERFWWNRGVDFCYKLCLSIPTLIAKKILKNASCTLGNIQLSILCKGGFSSVYISKPVFLHCYF